MKNNVNLISKVYLVSDTHFYHHKLIEVCNRPQNFEQKIINQWKNTVSSNDIVYHLGDVTFGSQEKLKEIMKDLPGTKILIKGNHDKKNSNNWFIQSGFAAVFDEVKTGNVILSHCPISLTKEEIDKGIINIHGHFHNCAVERWEPELKELITNNHFLLILEEINYCPVSLELAKKKKFVKNTKQLLINAKKVP